jgi:hypothetical protein
MIKRQAGKFLDELANFRPINFIATSARRDFRAVFRSELAANLLTYIRPNYTQTSECALKT